MRKIENLYGDRPGGVSPRPSIRPNPAQPRKVFEQTGLQELAASILQHGILQPLSVRRVGTSYESLPESAAAGGENCPVWRRSHVCL